MLVVGLGCGGGEGSGGAGGEGGAGEGGGAANRIEVTLFHTGDEEGYLLADRVSSPGEVRGGAANLRTWLGDAGYTSQDLLLSSGDAWSGPAISSWVEGASTVDVFNAMGYDALAIGSHELDFGLDTLRARRQEAAFPFLSANAVDSTTGESADFAEPFVVLETRGVSVGVVGLTATNAATATHPRSVVDLRFEAYADALDRHVPLARAAGAEVMVVLSSGCVSTLAAAVATSATEVDVVLGGHCPDAPSFELDGVVYVTSGNHFGGFSKIDIVVDERSREVVDARSERVEVAYPYGRPNPVTPDPDVQMVVERWRSQVDEDLDVPIGFTWSPIEPRTWLAANWVVDSWLDQHPEADVAMVNFGALREPVGVGEITLGSVVGLMPFKNVLFLIELTGAQLQSTLVAAADVGVLGGPYPAVGGMVYEVVDGAATVTLDSGTFDPAATYHVIVTDFMYYGGGGYALSALDPTPVDLGEHMRDPVVAWTVAVGSDEMDSLEPALDPDPRDQGP